jgi:HK97 family phage prohead protease
MAILHKNASQAAGLETKRLKFAECKLAVAETDPAVMEFKGYGAVFGNVDSYGDMIEKGAFSAYLDDVKSGKQDWPAMLKQHGGWGVTSDDYTPVGVYSELSEDDFGLKTTGILADTESGSDLYKLMKMQPRPAISGLSIGYYVRESEYGGKSDPFDRLIKKIDLVEISIVTFPANGKARISGVKSAQAMNDHELERTLRDVLGLSQKEAKTVIARGFRALRADADAGSEELKRMTALLERNTTNFQPK